MTVYSFEEILARAAKLGVSQKQMCSVADVSESTLSKAKADGREPTAKTRNKLSNALHKIARERGVQLVEDYSARAVL